MLYRWKRVYNTRFYIVQAFTKFVGGAKQEWVSAAIVDDFGNLVLVDVYVDYPAL